MCNNSEVLTYDWIKTGGRSASEIHWGKMQNVPREETLWPIGQDF